MKEGDSLVLNQEEVATITVNNEDWDERIRKAYEKDLYAQINSENLTDGFSRN